MRFNIFVNAPRRGALSLEHIAYLHVILQPLVLVFLLCVCVSACGFVFIPAHLKRQ